MKRSVSKQSTQAMVLGALLGLACAILDASPAVVYGVSSALVGIFVWINLGPGGWHPLRYLRRRL